MYQVVRDVEYLGFSAGEKVTVLYPGKLCIVKTATGEEKQIPKDYLREVLDEEVIKENFFREQQIYSVIVDIPGDPGFYEGERVTMLWKDTDSSYCVRKSTGQTLSIHPDFLKGLQEFNDESDDAFRASSNSINDGSISSSLQFNDENGDELGFLDLSNHGSSSSSFIDEEKYLKLSNGQICEVVCDYDEFRENEKVTVIREDDNRNCVVIKLSGQAVSIHKNLLTLTDSQVKTSKLKNGQTCKVMCDNGEFRENEKVKVIREDDYGNCYVIRHSGQQGEIHRNLLTLTNTQEKKINFNNGKIGKIVYDYGEFRQNENVTVTGVNDDGNYEVLRHSGHPRPIHRNFLTPVDSQDDGDDEDDEYATFCASGSDDSNENDNLNIEMIFDDLIMAALPNLETIRLQLNFSNWNGESLSISDEAIVKKKMIFFNPDQENYSAGTKLLKSKSSEELSYILLALEYLNKSEGDEYLELIVENLETYFAIRITSPTSRKCTLHPLFFLALYLYLKAKGAKEDSYSFKKKFEEYFDHHDLNKQLDFWIPREDEGFVDERDGPMNDTPTTSNPLLENWESMKSEKGWTSPVLDKIMALLGLDKVKEEAFKIFKIHRRRKKIKGLSTKNYSFEGNPGTGKTTVARLFGELFLELGIRQKQTEVTSGEKLKALDDQQFDDLIQSCMDGVLVIDEAYTLNPKGDFKGVAPFGKLLSISEDHRDSITLILTGYRKEMDDKLFSYNPGFQSRFQRITFDDFSKRELKLIWKSLVDENESVSCHDGVADVVSRRLAKNSGEVGFGNARDVRTMFQSGLDSAAQSDSDEDIVEITIENVIGPRPDTSCSNKRWCPTGGV